MPRRPSVFALSLLALISFAGCEAFTGDAEGSANEKSQQGDGDRVLVRVGQFSNGRISDRLPVAAGLEAVREAEVFAEVAGVIREVVAEEGDFVPKGDPVVFLVADDFTLVRENKKILLDQSETRLSQTDLALREGKSLLEQKKLLLLEAETEYSRLFRLSEGAAGIISQEELEAKRYLRDRLQIERQSIDLQIEKYELLKTEAAQNTRLAAVELQTAELNVSRTVIRSPLDGYVSYLDLKAGEQVTTTSLVFHVVSLEKLRARLHVPQRELRSLRVAQAVNIKSDVYPAKEFTGEVTVINPVIQENGTVTVIVEVTDRDALLKPGMFVSGEIVLNTHEKALLVSKKTVSYVRQEPVLFLVEDNVARRYVLTPGFSDRDSIEVLALTALDGSTHDLRSAQVVLVGHNNLKDGSPVEIEGSGVTVAGSGKN